MGKPKCCDWVATDGGDRAKNAVHAGVDGEETVYVARAHHNGAIVPGKFVSGHSHAYIPYNMEEVAVERYEILVAPAGSLSWVSASNGDVPPHALQGGQDKNGEIYYIGRVIMDGTVTVGKVHPSHQCCYIPYGGKEHAHKQYEILVRNLLGQFLNV